MRFLVLPCCLALLLILGEGCMDPAAVETYYADYDYSASGYLLNDPDVTYDLPFELVEVSGLCRIEDHTLGCVQDEDGVLFLFDTNEKQVVRRIKFEGGGDYEGIAIREEIVYVLKSNGHLYRFPFSDSDEIASESYNTAFKSRNDVEGLVYDKQNDRFLMACKGAPEVDGNDAKGKVVYALDPATMELSADPVISIEPEDVEPFYDEKGRPWELNHNFKPSAIGIHPHTGTIFLLCNVGKVLILIKPDGTIQDLFHLNPRLFRQPEGICFDSRGNLYISNEGKGRRANILRFNYEVR